MRYAAAAIAGMALLGAALFADSVGGNIVPGSGTKLQHKAPVAVETRSEIVTPKPASPPGLMQVEAGEDDLIDSAEGLDPSGFDPSGSDPDPEPQRAALPPEQVGQPGEFIEPSSSE